MSGSLRGSIPHLQVLSERWSEAAPGTDRGVWAAAGVALVLHSLLLLLHLPERVPPPAPTLDLENPAITLRWLEPKPKLEPARTTPPPQAKRVPRPDPTPDEPEPLAPPAPPPLAVPTTNLAPLPAAAVEPVAYEAGPAPAPPPPAPEPGPIRVSPGEGPKILLRVEPRYPAIARHTRREGTVVLDAVILKSGAVAEVKVLRSASAALDQAAIEALLKWRFSTGERDVLMILTVNFRLQ